MGNCITGKAIFFVPEDDRRRQGGGGRGKANSLKKTAAATATATATFRTADYDCGGHGGGGEEEDRKNNTGTVRVKLVLTKKELDRILTTNINGDYRDPNYYKDLLVDRLLINAITTERRRRRRSVSDEVKFRNQWKPSLETISEEEIV